MSTETAEWLKEMLGPGQFSPRSIYGATLEIVAAYEAQSARVAALEAERDDYRNRYGAQMIAGQELIDQAETAEAALARVNALCNGVDPRSWEALGYPPCVKVSSVRAALLPLGTSKPTEPTIQETMSRVRESFRAIKPAVDAGGIGLNLDVAGTDTTTDQDGQP